MKITPVALVLWAVTIYVTAAPASESSNTLLDAQTGTHRQKQAKGATATAHLRESLGEVQSPETSGKANSGIVSERLNKIYGGNMLNYTFPCVCGGPSYFGRHTPLKVGVQFKVDLYGFVEARSIKVTQSSGSKKLDYGAQMAVLLASPYKLRGAMDDTYDALFDVDSAAVSVQSQASQGKKQEPGEASQNAWTVNGRICAPASNLSIPETGGPE